MFVTHILAVQLLNTFFDPISTKHEHDEVQWAGTFIDRCIGVHDIESKILLIYFRTIVLCKLLKCVSIFYRMKKKTV